MFLDEAIVEFKSGKGGSGAASFRREKFVPRGGPNGSDGGKGGDVLLVADRNKRTLYDFKFQTKFEATSGDHAIGNKKGRDGKTLIIKLPVGTVVTDTETGDVLCDLAYDGAKYRICRGGRGGYGNLHFVNSVRQAPNFAQKGEPADRVLAKLELKLLADVGLVGLPNAGKSTLISAMSAARPKIADYPFTTIVPNLGVASVGDDSFVIADMPGLIEGAHKGTGLGHQFLKHIERTRLLVHVVDVFPIDESDPMANYHLIEAELRQYSEEIWARPRFIALNKIDLIPAERLAELESQFAETGRRLFAISAATGKGVDPLKEALGAELATIPPPETVVVIRPEPADMEQFWEVVEVEGGFRVQGRRVERMVAMTDLGKEEAVRYLHRRLTRMGVIEKLREAGAEDGDTVTIGELEFQFEDEA